MKYLLSTYLMIMLLNSCTTFVPARADKTVQLTKDDLSLFGEFKDNLLSDLSKLDSLYGRNYGNMHILNTNSYYLYQISRARYEPLITELKRRKIYIDDIEISDSKVIHFRLKEVDDNTHLPHYSYAHSLVYGSPQEYVAPYSIKDVLKDSLINSEWRYIYTVSQVGH